MNMTDHEDDQIYQHVKLREMLSFTAFYQWPQWNEEAKIVFVKKKDFRCLHGYMLQTNFTNQSQILYFVYKQF